MTDNKRDILGMVVNFLFAMGIAALFLNYGHQLDQFTLMLGAVCCFVLGCCFKGAMDCLLVRKLEEMRQDLKDLQDE